MVPVGTASPLAAPLAKSTGVVDASEAVDVDDSVAEVVDRDVVVRVLLVVDSVVGSGVGVVDVRLVDVVVGGVQIEVGGVQIEVGGVQVEVFLVVVGSTHL